MGRDEDGDFLNTVIDEVSRCHSILGTCNKIPRYYNSSLADDIENIIMGLLENENIDIVTRKHLVAYMNDAALCGIAEKTVSRFDAHVIFYTVSKIQQGKYICDEYCFALENALCRDNNWGSGIFSKAGKDLIKDFENLLSKEINEPRKN